MTISRQFYEVTKLFPNKVAIIAGNKQLTYSGLLSLVQQQAHILRLNNIERGDHIMTQLEGIDFVVMLLAAADAGVCLVPLGKDATRETIAKAYNACDCKFLINAGFEPVERYANRMRLTFSGRPEDNLLIITTSGSTGEPKPILLKQGTKLLRVDAMAELYNCLADDTILISTPLHHSMGQRLALIAALRGATLVIMPQWSAIKWWDAVLEHKVTFAVPVAAQVKQIVNTRPLVNDDEVHLRCIVSSSATLERTDTNKMPCPVYNCYGTTEVAIVTSTDADSPQGSVGKPICGVNIETMTDGEILVETPLLFDGYYNQPELTESAAWHGIFSTGDLGKIGEDGNLYYLGRIKELINVGGTKVYPQDVEAVVSGITGVVECAAFPHEDDALGEVVAVAVVVAGDEIAAVMTEKAVQAFCLPRLTDPQLPRFVYVVKELPKTETGKLQRTKLAETLGGV